MEMPYDGAVLVCHQLHKKGYEVISNGEEKRKHSRYKNQCPHCCHVRGVHSGHIFTSRESHPLRFMFTAARPCLAKRCFAPLDETLLRDQSSPCQAAAGCSVREFALG